MWSKNALIAGRADYKCSLLHLRISAAPSCRLLALSGCLDAGEAIALITIDV